MSWPARSLAGCLVTILLGIGPAVVMPGPAAASAPAAASGTGSVRTGCPAGGVEVDLAGSSDIAVVSGHAASACRAASRTRTAGAAQPYWTYEIACSTDRAHAEEGLCSSTPCDDGLFFAFRTLHRPDGSTEAAGFSCVSLGRARVGPALTVADVFAAVRRVRLPAGAIQIAPSGRGLANLPARLWLAGDAEPPLDLRLAGSDVHAEFRPVRYRWTVAAREPGRDGQAASAGGAVGPGGAGEWEVPAMAASSGRDGEARVTFTGRGDFVVAVVTTWSASAFLDGRFVGQVDGLSSTARVAYPVAELRAALSG